MSRHIFSKINISKGNCFPVTIAKNTTHCLSILLTNAEMTFFHLEQKQAITATSF